MLSGILKRELCDVFLTVHLIIDFFSSYQPNAHFFYSITIYMLHYNPQHVSSSTLLIFRRTNCIITASGTVTLCKQSYSMPIKSGLQSALQPLVSSLSVNSRTVCRLRADCSPLSTGILYFTESDNIRSCNNTICPPEDEQGTTRNMLRNIM